MKKTIRINFLLLTLFLVACQSQAEPEPLNGSTWSLSQLNGHSLVAGSHIELQFDLDTFSGFGGCNAYGGGYQISGDQFAVEDGIESTAMACLTPEGVGEQEIEYLLALQESQRYQLNGNRLEFKNDGGDLTLVFIHQQPEAALDMDSLSGSQWQVLAVNGKSLLQGSQITLEFVEPGLVEGFGGCRSYQAEYIESRDGVRFSSIRMGQEDCRQQNLLVQEQDFTDFFTWADHFELVGETLVLVTQRGEEIAFIPLGE